MIYKIFKILSKQKFLFRFLICQLVHIFEQLILKNFIGENPLGEIVFIFNRDIQDFLEGDDGCFTTGDEVFYAGEICHPNPILLLPSIFVKQFKGFSLTVISHPFWNDFSFLIHPDERF